MSWIAFSLAVLALLASPGPTNTLLFLAGAERGWRAAAGLVGVVVLAYLSVLVPLGLLGTRMLAALPVVYVLSGGWVAWLAWRLWRPKGAGPQQAVTARSVLVTTLLNPKGLIIGLGLLQSAPSLPDAVAVCGLLIAGVSAAWAVAGSWTTGATDSSRRMLWVRRGSALWLGALAIVLLARGLSA